MPVAFEDDYPIKFSSPAQSFKKTFKSFEDYKSFMDGERSFWSSLAAAAPQAPQYTNEMLDLAGRRAVERAAHDVPSKAASSVVNGLRRLENEGAILSGGKWGKSLLALAQSNPPLVAGAAFAASATIPGSVTIQEGVSYRATASSASTIAAGLGTLLDISAHDVPRKHFEELSVSAADLVREMDATLASYREKLEISTATAGAEIAEGVKKHGEGLEEIQATFESNLVNMRSELAAALSDATSQLDDFKRKVRVDVVSEVPSTFWSNKADQHRTVAIIFGVLFILVAGGGVAWLITGAVDTFATATQKIVQVNSNSPFLALVPLAFITLPALAFAWVLRHISRVLVQNLSLEADARLRSTITSTFRALAADRSMSEAELAIALQALFRPIDGKDHSDIAPPTLGDILKLNDKQGN